MNIVTMHHRLTHVPRFLRFPVVFLLLLCLAALPACKKKSQVTSYTVPKSEPFASQPAESPAPPDEMQPNLPPGHPPLNPSVEFPSVPIAAAPGLEWSLPPGWVQDPNPGAMRIASFKVKQDDLTADISITSLGLGADELLPNINRWRGQLGLPPISEADLSSAVQPITIDSHSGHLIIMQPADATDAQANGTIAAMLTLSDRVWFFKITGPAPLIEAQTQPFIEFLHSVHFTQQDAAP